MAYSIRVGIFDHLSLRIGGGQLVVARMAAQLSDAYQVDVIHSGRGYTIPRLASAFQVDLRRVQERILPDSLESLGLPGRRSTWVDLPSRLRADRALTGPYDLFIYSGHGVPPFNSARHGLIYCHFPFELHPIHELPLTAGWDNRSAFSRWGRSIAYRLLWKHRMRGYQAVQCNSRFTAGWINRLWYRPAEVLYPPVALQVPRGEKRNSIVSVGRFVQSDNKNLAQQLKAFREFYSTVGGNWRLHMIGFCADIPQDRAYVQHLRDLALGLPITFIVNAERKTVIRRLAEAKLFWHTTGLNTEPEEPQAQEHFGIATVEAMLAGCVPLVPKRGGQTEIVEHEASGLLCENLDQLVRHSVRLAHEDDLRREMSRRAKDLSKRFSASAFERSFGQTVNRLLADHGEIQAPRDAVAFKPTSVDPKIAG